MEKRPSLRQITKKNPVALPQGKLHHFRDRHPGQHTLVAHLTQAAVRLRRNISRKAVRRVQIHHFTLAAVIQKINHAAVQKMREDKAGLFPRLPPDALLRRLAGLNMPADPDPSLST